VEKHWIDRFADMLPPSGEVLDLGCGAGQPVATYLVGRGHRVTGVDSSPEMIALFRGRLPGQSAIIGDMRGLRLERRFSGLLAWDSFFHLGHDDQRGMFPVFAEHACRKAPLLFTTGTTHGEAIGTLEGDPLYHASLAPEEYTDLLRDNGFSVVAHVPEDPNCGGRTVWLARQS
jgi:SAM-dependent methyltransferase